ncbi:transaldolase [Chloropicon primus]|uniref:Transaldolase n=2 Tax=Chloropicon primus TaxID=1764295 RepID=A0A5B8MFU6_9CHLO|nr:transaldolase [Chloropicon primus]UPQ97744.1 transaldolase [Chloropicon primus]|eukprot:QDZ18535.1 transaldolase [Chloropicon primus]
MVKVGVARRQGRNGGRASLSSGATTGGTRARARASLSSASSLVGTWRRARSGLVSSTCCATASPSYDAPSNISGGTQLESLSKLSEVVRNTVVLEEGGTFKDATCSSAAAVTSRILLKVLRNPVGLRQYEQPIKSALAYIEQTQPKEKDSLGLVHCSLDKAMVNLGSMLAEQVDGRVSTEVDARFANDKDKIVEQVLYLSKLYEEVGVGNDRVLYRIPATWDGIQAAKVLEAQGIQTLLTLVCSLTQCIAAAEAGVSVVQLYVGRVRDWYRKHPNAIRNPDGPREDAGLSSFDADPGRELVSKCYNYLHKFYPKTKLMAGDIRSKEDALSIAGCDYIVLRPQIIEELQGTPSMLGYNDGLIATKDYADLMPELSPEKAEATKFSDRYTKGWGSEKEFMESMGECGRDLLQKSLQRYCDSFEQLEPYFSKISGIRTN